MTVVQFCMCVCSVFHNYFTGLLVAPALIIRLREPLVTWTCAAWNGLSSCSCGYRPTRCPSGCTSRCTGSWSCATGSCTTATATSPSLYSVENISFATTTTSATTAASSLSLCYEFRISLFPRLLVLGGAGLNVLDVAGEFYSVASMEFLLGPRISGR